jgi:hypothetical protein
MYFITSFFGSSEPIKPPVQAENYSDQSKGSFVELEFC